MKNDLWPSSFHWWIDDVGGFLAITRSRVVIGQPGDKRCDIGILGDLSACHAEIHRESTGNILLAHAETTVNDKPGQGFLLRDGDRIKMRAVELTYHQPLSWSSTACLRLTSRHRLPLSLDGVVLLGETCVLGPRVDAHIRARWPQPLYISWKSDGYWLRASGEFVIDGKEYHNQGPLTPTSSVRGPWGSFHWEKVAS